MKSITATYSSPLGSIAIESDGQAITSLRFSDKDDYFDGKAVSYGEIAWLVGCRSAQAVGQAVGANPVALLIPCHRVIAANGQLGGYAYGPERKKRLLELEQL